MSESASIDNQIASTLFACDLEKCKGACCTMPGPRGAPLLDGEIEEIERSYPVIKKYLSFRHKDTIEERGLFQGRSGDMTTQVVDQQACVFVVFENGIASCAFEKGFLNNEIPWRKPISCHLFPIRASREPRLSLRLESVSVCQPAFEKGARAQVPVWRFLKDSLIRAFGVEWYTDFESQCKLNR